MVSSHYQCASAVLFPDRGAMTIFSSIPLLLNVVLTLYLNCGFTFSLYTYVHIAFPASVSLIQCHLPFKLRLGSHPVTLFSPITWENNHFSCPPNTSSCSLHLLVDRMTRVFAYFHNEAWIPLVYRTLTSYAPSPQAHETLLRSRPLHSRTNSIGTPSIYARLLL